MDDRLNASIRHIERPARLRRLPISDKGFPVPWFVQWIDGKPDFRVMDSEKLVRAIKKDLCWQCGATLGRHKVFTIGGMCAISRTIAEPPAHRDCALYSVRACPFLSRPAMSRNEKNLPGEACEPAGIGIKRNPGVVLLWTCHDYKVFRAPDGGVLFKIGEPHRIEAFSRGRPATTDELDESIRTGLPILTQIAAEEGPGAMADLARAIERTNQLFKRFLPRVAEPGERAAATA
jgi:hypothetical protein